MSMRELIAIDGVGLKLQRIREARDRSLGMQLLCPQGHGSVQRPYIADGPFSTLTGRILRSYAPQF